MREAGSTRPSPAFAQALAIDPRMSDAHFNLGAALLAGDFPDRAIEAFDQALAIKPDYVEAIVQRGLAHKARGHLRRRLKTGRRPCTSSHG